MYGTDKTFPPGPSTSALLPFGVFLSFSLLPWDSRCFRVWAFLWLPHLPTCAHFSFFPIPLGRSLLISLFVPLRKNWSPAGSVCSWLYWCCIVKHSLCYSEISLIRITLYLFSQQMCRVIGRFSNPIFLASYPFLLPTFGDLFSSRPQTRGICAEGPLWPAAPGMAWPPRLSGVPAQRERWGTVLGTVQNFLDKFQELFWCPVYTIRIVLRGMLTKPQPYILWCGQ